MEMGISVTEETRPAPNAEQHVQAEHVQNNHVQTPNSVRKSSSSSSSTTAASNFFQKIASKTKLMKRSPIQMYANIDIDNAIGAMPSNHQSTNSKLFSTNSPIHHQHHQEIYRNPDHMLDHNQVASNNHNSSNEGEQAEEHILPDSFDEVSQIHPTSGLETGNGNEKSSVSPSSRKSASSHASRGSQDSGIGIPIKQTGTGNNNIIATNHENVRSPGNNTVVMQVGVASTSSHTLSNKRTADFSKAWYDVPSDDETEAPEADSLASIISHRGSSDDEN